MLAPGRLRAEFLYMAGASGVLQTNADGSNWQALANARPEEDFLDVAVNSQTGTVYWVRRLFGGIAHITRHVPGKPDSAVASGFNFGECVTVDEDAGKLYSAGSVIVRCGLNGENLETVVSNPNGLVLAIDIDPLGGPGGGEMYWVEYTQPGDGRIVRGSAVFGVNRQTIVAGIGVPLDLCLDVARRKIYWVDAQRAVVQRADLDGSAVETIIASGLTEPTSIAIDRTTMKLYIMDEGANSVLRSDLDGKNLENVFTVYQLDRIDVGPDAPVGVTAKTWGQVKQLYRGETK